MLAPTLRANCWMRVILVLVGSLLTVCSVTSAPKAQQTPTPAASMVPELKSRAESGDGAAQRQLWQFLLSADPGSPACELALDWLQSLASRNEPSGQFLLGYLYENGKIFPRDYGRAAEYYRNAALQNYPPAENNFGFLYQTGRGVPRDLAIAFQWYRTAALHGNSAAQYNLGTFYYLGYGTHVDYVQAAKWLHAAAEQGLAAGQNSIAYAYLKGIGVPLDYSQAAHWAQLAAKQGHPRSQALLGYLYEHGEGLPLDYVAAYTWYSRAVASGDRTNMDRLKSLSQVMTRKQISEANSMVSAGSIPTDSEADGSPASSSARSIFPDF